MTFATDAIETEKDMVKKVTSFMNELMKSIALLLGVMTYLISLFLSPEWMSGNLFGIQNYLKAIWILISNVVYVIFAFILIGIAFVNIVGIDSEKYQLNKMLPKFIIGILIVPFSWFIVQFVLSLTSILSVMALNLPYDTFKGYSAAVKNYDLPTKCTVNFSGELKPEENTSKTGESGDKKANSAKSQISKYWNCYENKDKAQSNKLKENANKETDATTGIYRLV